MVVNRKKLYRLYMEERLVVRKRGGRKRALGTRAPMTIPQGANQRWFGGLRRGRLDGRPAFPCVLCVHRRLHPGVPGHGGVDNSITGQRVSRELDHIAQRRGWSLLLVVSDNGTEFTSNAMLGWQQDHGVD